MTAEQRPWENEEAHRILEQRARILACAPEKEEKEDEIDLFLRSLHFE